MAKIYNQSIRNLDKQAYLAIRAKAVLAGISVGELISQAIKNFLENPEFKKSEQSFQDLPVFDFGADSKRLSSEIDDLLYS